MKAAEIRTKFLKYFERNGHTIVESSSLVPSNDPTLLFTNAGMNQFKDCFLGKEKRPYVRATTSQKCVRAGGKHNDLENVGFTARHHTFFEMLGNFSFGDYFKKEAIHYAWEFVTKELKLPKDRLYVSVYKDDEEAAEIWHKQEGVPKERISRFGEKDNFWSMGDTGPCGPCTELFIDRGEKYAGPNCKGNPDCKVGCDCDRFMEFWNLVFMQYDRSADGKLTPLPKPAVDTGAGLERIASILQDVETNYDTDLFQDVISRVSKLAGKPYDPKSPDAVSFRVIADHARASAFLIGDGVLPANEGRGYVLRRIMRRAIRHGRKLGFEGPFLAKAAGYVIDAMKDAYPSLETQRAFIERATLAEEEQFLKTLERGLELLEEERKKLAASGKKTLPGDVAFKLYDTFGFPLDLTRVICEEHGLAVDEAGFEKGMEEQRERARASWKGSGDAATEAVYYKVSETLAKAGKTPRFTGYDDWSEESECVALLVRDGEEWKPADLAAGGEALAAFAVTPFYGESGGQVGDRGRVSAKDFEARVTDVKKPVGELILAKLEIRKGTIRVGGRYLQETDREVRSRTARNHTATHLLHWALREVLGKHVKQAGSLVTPELLRFDFNHFQAMTPDELKRAEDLINERVWSDFAVSKREMAKDQAVAAGAIAFFGEKYGEKVRVVSVGDFSVELCGGTHVDRSSDIGLFKIGSEAGIAAGVRRIIAYTSKGAFEFLRSREDEVKKVRELLRASSTEEAVERVESLQAREKELRKKIEELEGRLASGESEKMLGDAVRIGGIRFLAKRMQGGAQALRGLAEAARAKNPDLVLFLASEDAGKAALVAASGKDAMATVPANALIQAASPLVEGRGGGKPDLAQAGGTKPAGIDAALKAAEDFVKGKAK